MAGFLDLAVALEAKIADGDRWLTQLRTSGWGLPAMSDLTDVQNTLASIIAGLIYPNGTGVVSAIGVATKIYPGWPAQEQLRTDLLAGTVNISIYAMPVEKRTTRYAPDWREISRGTVTLTATVASNTITIGGTVSVPQVLTVIVNGVAYNYGVQALDTLATIATGLVTLISAAVPCSSVGPVITIPVVSTIVTRVGTDGVLAREIRRTEKHFNISVWSPTPDLRTAVGRIVDLSFSKSAFIFLPDLTHGRLDYVRTWDEDKLQNELCYRRDMVWSVEFPTIETTTGTAVTSGASVNYIVPPGQNFNGQYLPFLGV